MDWEAIVKRGVESDELDYKAAQNWNRLTRTGRAKFARHCMAMANTKGGFIVVGVGEDASGKPALFTGLTEEESQSFDPTEIGNFVNRFADPQVEFTLERPVVDGRRYVIFSVKRFSQLPHVCTGGCDHELIQGVFYIRTADASSRPAYRASEIHALIQRAMRNQRELLGRMIRGLLYENHMAAPSAESQSRFTEELNHSRRFFQKCIRPENSAVQLELSIFPEVYETERFSLSELRSASAEPGGITPETGFIAPDELRRAYFTNVSLRFGGQHHAWQIYRSGLFHFLRVFPELRHGPVQYEPLCALLTDAVSYCATLFGALGFSDEILHIEIRLDNVENRQLIFPGGEPADAVCRIPEIAVHRSCSAADLISGRAAHADELIRRVCERFNVSDGRHRDLPGWIRRRLELPEENRTLPSVSLSEE